MPVGPAPAAHAAPAPAAPRYVQPVQQPQPQAHFAAAPIAPRLSEDYEDGQYDPRWNDPSFQGDNSPRAAPAPVHVQQPQYVQQPAPVQQQQPHYVPQPQPQFHAAPVQPVHYTTTTPNPHRFQPPGQLALSRTPDGFSFSFNKV